MQILTETFGDVLVAHAPDEFTDDAAHLLLNAVKRAADSGQHRVVLQLDRSDVFDSTALGTLLDLQDHVRSLGGGLKICGLTETGQKIFEMTRLHQKLDSFESVIDAVGSFR